ncbi:MAG: hypothetical protein ACXAC2_05600 [Candidatus Kariarchaeaceae archaeon]|jgi:hypothetical protein
MSPTARKYTRGEAIAIFDGDDLEARKAMLATLAASEPDLITEIINAKRTEESLVYKFFEDGKGNLNPTAQFNFGNGNSRPLSMGIAKVANMDAFIRSGGDFSKVLEKLMAMKEQAKAADRISTSNAASFEGYAVQRKGK